MPIKIQLTANWCPIRCQLRSKQMPIVIQYDAYLDPIRCQLRSNPITIEIHSNTNWDPIWPNWYTIWWTQCHLRSKTLDWRRFRVLRVPPLKNFWGTSQPMRSQHSELSTNRKARFWPENQCQQNLKSTNPMPICQFTYFPIHWKSSFISGSFNQPLASIEASDRLKVSELDEVPFPDFIQFSVTLPLQCHSDHCNATRSKFMAKYATPLPLCQSSATLSLHCHLTTGVSLE